MVSDSEGLEDVKIVIVRESTNDVDPSFLLTITGDGNSEYNGIKNVKSLGIHKTKISQDVITEIIDRSNMIYFFSLKDSYPSINKSASDTLRTIVSIQANGKSKKIEFTNNSREPHSLNSLIHQILTLTNTNQLIGPT